MKECRPPANRPGFCRNKSCPAPPASDAPGHTARHLSGIHGECPSVPAKPSVWKAAPLPGQVSLRRVGGERNSRVARKSLIAANIQGFPEIQQVFCRGWFIFNTRSVSPPPASLATAAVITSSAGGRYSHGFAAGMPLGERLDVPVMTIPARDRHPDDLFNLAQVFEFVL